MKQQIGEQFTELAHMQTLLSDWLAALVTPTETLPLPT